MTLADATMLALAYIGLISIGRKIIAWIERNPRQNAPDELAYGDHPFVPHSLGTIPGGSNAHPAAAGVSVHTTHAASNSAGAQHDHA